MTRAWRGGRRRFVGLARLLALLVVALFFGATPVAAVGVLEPLPESIEGRIPAGGSRSFEVALDAGEWLRVEVEQVDVDVVLRLSEIQREIPREERSSIATADGPFGASGVETVLHVADEPTRLEVEVRSGAAGTFRLRSQRRPADAEDRRRTEAFTLYADAEALRRRDGWAAAAGAYADAAEALRAAGDGPLEVLALYRRAQAFDRARDFDAEIALLEEAAARSRDLDLAFEEAHVVNRRAWVLEKRDRHAEAAPGFRRAADLFLEIGDLGRRAEALNDAGRSFDTAGRLAEAREAYLAARDLAREVGDVEREGTETNNLGEIHLRLGQPRVALDLFLDALELRRRADHLVGEAITWTSLGTAYRRLDRLDEAREAFARSFSAHRTCPDRVENPSTCQRDKLANALIGLGLVEHKRGRLDPAERAFRSALDVLDALDEPRSRAITGLNLALVHLDRQPSETEEARERTRQSLDALVEIGARQGVAIAYRTLAKIERASGPEDPERVRAAERWQRLAVEQVANLRGAADAASLRDDYSAFRAEYSEEWIDLLVDLDRLDPGAGWMRRAFEASEAHRARGLAERILGARAELETRLDPELRAREARLADRLVARERERLRLLALGEPARAAGALDAIEAEQRRLALRLDEVRAELRARSPRDAALLQPPSPTLEGLRRLLDDETQLLEIALGRSRSHLWLVDPDRLVYRELPGRERLEALARQAHANLEASWDASMRVQAEATLADLSHLLVAPVADVLDRSRLLVVVDGALQLVPFAALPAPGDGEPLVETREVVSVPSASLLEILRRPGALQSIRTLFVVADPVFGPEDPRLDPQSALLATRRGDPFGPLLRLPATGAEAETLRALLPPGEVEVVRGFEANLERVDAETLSAHRILHFATHGRLHPERPELAGLELSRLHPDGSPRPGTLWAHSLYDVELAADLVVLSACRTALGPWVRGEGFLGLTRAFFYAGAPRVVVSLWNVDDDATRALMEHFYRALLEDELPPAAALRRAQRELRRDPAFASPAHWAGFVLQGDWR